MSPPHKGKNDTGVLRAMRVRCAARSCIGGVHKREEAWLGGNHVREGEFRGFPHCKEPKTAKHRFLANRYDSYDCVEVQVKRQKFTRWFCLNSVRFVKANQTEAHQDSMPDHSSISVSVAAVVSRPAVPVAVAESHARSDRGWRVPGRTASLFTRAG